MHDRIYEFLSDGVDVIVSTDHNVVADYAPIIADLGVGPLPRQRRRRRADHATAGVTSARSRWPTTSGARASGAVLVHGRTAERLLRRRARASRRPPSSTCTTPASIHEIGYFNLDVFDAHSRPSPAAGFSSTSTRVEVLNGYQDGSAAASIKSSKIGSL